MFWCGKSFLRVQCRSCTVQDEKLGKQGRRTRRSIVTQEKSLLRPCCREPAVSRFRFLVYRFAVKSWNIPDLTMLTDQGPPIGKLTGWSTISYYDRVMQDWFEWVCKAGLNGMPCWVGFVVSCSEPSRFLPAWRAMVSSVTIGDTNNLSQSLTDAYVRTDTNACLHCA